MVAFKRPDCIQHVLYNAECFLSKVPNWRKNVTFVPLYRNLVLFKGMDSRTLGATLVALENLFRRTGQPSGVELKPQWSLSYERCIFEGQLYLYCGLATSCCNIPCRKRTGNVTDMILEGWGMGSDCLMGILRCSFLSEWWKWFKTE